MITTMRINAAKLPNSLTASIRLRIEGCAFGALAATVWLILECEFQETRVQEFWGSNIFNVFVQIFEGSGGLTNVGKFICFGRAGA
jgi:hypothetical protein